MDAVDVVRAWADGLVRGERGDHLWHPDAEIINARGWVMDVTYEGGDSLDRWWTDLTEAFSEYEFVVEAIDPLDGGEVLTTQRLIGAFRASAIPIDVRWWSVLTVRDGRIARAVGFLSEREMRAATGR